MSKGLREKLPTAAERDRALSSWIELNTYLRKLQDPIYALDLLRREKKGVNRPTFVSRIFARYNRLRGLKERRGLLNE
jgi:hypothetical protein